MNKEIPEERLSHRVVKSGFWVFALRITDRIFYLIRLVILARILAPHDFGLMGIAMLTMMILENFSQTGFQAALIQKKENIESYLNTAWTTMIIRGIILFSILFFIAPYAATFFKSPEAKPIIQVVGFSFLIQASTNIGIIYFQKELEFNKQFIYQLSGTLADFIVAVSAALILRNVWALIFGLLAGNFVRFVVSYFIHPYRPRLSFNFDKVKELSGFGRWVLGSSILLFLITQGDSVLVGKLLGVTMLGFYQMAYRISNMPVTEITHVISQVTFPAYTKIQDNIPKLREAYLKVLQMTAFLSFLISGLILVLAPDFTRIFLGEKWMPMVPVMQVLVLWGLIRSMGATTGPIFYSIGNPKILTKLQFLQIILLITLIYPLTIQWGILGTSLSVVCAALIPNLIAYFSALRIIKGRVSIFSKSIMFPLIMAFVAISFISILKISWTVSKFLLADFILYLIFYGLIFFSVTFLFDKFFNYKMQPLFKEIFLTIKEK